MYKCGRVAPDGCGVYVKSVLLQHIQSRHNHSQHGGRSVAGVQSEIIENYWTETS